VAVDRVWRPALACAAGRGRECPIYEHVAGSLLALIDDCYAHGCFREWASFTHSALAFCHEQHAATLTEPIARAVLELHAGGEIEHAA